MEGFLGKWRFLGVKGCTEVPQVEEEAGREMNLRKGSAVRERERVWEPQSRFISSYACCPCGKITQNTLEKHRFLWFHPAIC